MFNIALSGVSGRMGQTLAGLIEQDPNLALALGLCQVPPSQTMNFDCMVAPYASTKKLDVIIDFSNPCGLPDYLKFAKQNKLPILLGTTGYNSEELASIKAASSDLAILLAPNTSIGINVLYNLIANAAKSLPHAQIEIIDTHHQHKLDQPSGTALEMGRVVAKQKNLNFAELAHFGFQLAQKTRPANSIGFSSLRMGEIVGEHQIFFNLGQEEICLSHRVFDRVIFAKGALQAAQWLVTQKPGLYQMSDMLKAI